MKNEFTPEEFAVMLYEEAEQGDEKKKKTFRQLADQIAKKFEELNSSIIVLVDGSR